MQFGDRLKELREEKDIKQSDLAKKFNISSSTIGMYEQNRRTPDFKLLSALADFFNVSVDYLLCRTDIRNYEEYTIAAHTDDRTQQLSAENRKTLDDFIDFLIANNSKKDE